MNNLEWLKNNHFTGSQWFRNKLTYPEEVKCDGWRGKRTATFFFLTAKVIMRFSFTFKVPQRKLSGLKNNRQNIHRNQPPNHHLLNILCFTFLAIICYQQKATVFIFLP